jgi:hypothetical protein
MRLRSRRRDVVVWTPSAGLARRYGTPWFTTAGRTGPVRRCLRIGGLLAVIGMVRVARAVRPRWRPLLAGGVLTAAGVMLRSGAGGLVFIPGLLLLVYAPLIEARPAAEDQKRRSALRRELAGYATLTQRRDLEATLDRYPDGVTRELRDILARQAAAAVPRSSIPGVGRR